MVHGDVILGAYGYRIHPKRGVKGEIVAYDLHGKINRIRSGIIGRILVGLDTQCEMILSQGHLQRCFDVQYEIVAAFPILKKSPGYHEIGRGPSALIWIIHLEKDNILGVSHVGHVEMKYSTTIFQRLFVGVDDHHFFTFSDSNIEGILHSHLVFEGDRIHNNELHFLGLERDHLHTDVIFTRLRQFGHLDGQEYVT